MSVTIDINTKCPNRHKAEMTKNTKNIAKSIQFPTTKNKIKPWYEANKKTIKVTAYLDIKRI